MNIILINPNTTKTMTASMYESVLPFLSKGVNLKALTAPFGVPSIEGYYDEAFAIQPIIEVIIPIADEIDGVVIGCFDDTGVQALRTILDVPVVGICQAAMQAASVVSNQFSVITTLHRSVPAIQKLAAEYGFRDICKRVRASEVPVLDLENNEKHALNLIEKEVDNALKQDLAEAIVLGCAGMSKLSHLLTKKYNVPIIDGVGAAVKLVEGLATLGIKTSSRGGYSRPQHKRYSGTLKKYSPKAFK
ncbi:MAG: Asp/Glu/hydantoin racemase [Rhodospirillaceae bacterium]|nr:Asp/Glu/hydantoin racemase [Rhodospirillaceae bacterium]